MSKRPILWLHRAQNSQQMAFGECLHKLSAEHDNLETIVFLKNVAQGDKKGHHYDVEGRLDLDLVHKAKHQILENKQAKVFICGPAKWMVATKDKLELLGVSQDRISLELFGTGSIQPSSARL
jgi:nitric oxide dioxygenase